MKEYLLQMPYGVENEVFVLCWVVKSSYYSLHITFFAAKPHQLCVVSPFLRYNPNQSCKNVIYTSEMTDVQKDLVCFCTL